MMMASTQLIVIHGYRDAHFLRWKLDEMKYEYKVLERFAKDVLYNIKDLPWPSFELPEDFQIYNGKA